MIIGNKYMSRRIADSHIIFIILQVCLSMHMLKLSTIVHKQRCTCAWEAHCTTQNACSDKSHDN